MIRRALRTFAQAFVAYFAANLVCAVAGLTEVDAIKTAILGVVISALAAGFAALMNLPQPKINEDNNDE